VGPSAAAPVLIRQADEGLTGSLEPAAVEQFGKDVRLRAPVFADGGESREHGLPSSNSTLATSRT
jgi:hypothetical protein